MTTPVDPRPYAGPTDLVTAADVARWLEEFRTDWTADAKDSPENAVKQVPVAVFGDCFLEVISRDLTARLDRERRQACRRGALANWRDACHSMRTAKNTRGRRRDRILTNAVWGDSLGFISWREDRAVRNKAAHIIDRLALALAFRAAARAR